MKRILSLLTAALLAGMLALPVCADVASPTATPEPTAMAAPTTEPAAALPKTLSAPMAIAEGTPPPDASAAGKAGAYIVGATATTVNGGEVGAIRPGERFNVVVQVADFAAYAYGLGCGKEKDTGDVKLDPGQIIENYISARVVSPAFTFYGVAEVGGETGDDGKYKFLKTGEIPTTAEGGDVETKEYGYYSYNLIFRDVVYNGGESTFKFTLNYPGSIVPPSDLSFTIGQCVNPEEEVKDTHTPQLVVRESSYGTGAIVAGTPFTLTFTLYATTSESAMEDLNDVIATVTLPDGVSLTGGSLSQYIGTVKAGGTRQVSFDILPSASFTGGVANIDVLLSGTGAVSGMEASTKSTRISVPIEQPDRFELGSLDVMDTYYVGEGGTVSLGFVNKGQNTVANLEASLTGTNFTADDTYLYIGNLAPGTENSVDFDIYPEMAGPITGVITLTYEYADGTTKTLTQEFSATAEDMMGGGMWEDPGFQEPIEPVEPEKTGLPIWGILLIVAAVVAGVVAAVVLVRRRRKAKAMASLGDDDEDF